MALLEFIIEYSIETFVLISIIFCFWTVQKTNKFSKESAKRQDDLIEKQDAMITKFTEEYRRTTSVLEGLVRDLMRTTSEWIESVKERNEVLTNHVIKVEYEIEGVKKDLRIVKTDVESIKEQLKN